MSGTKEIKDRIDSIQNTLKICNAMYMISSSKLRKARTALSNTEPYFYTLQSVIQRILRHLPHLEDIYFESDESKKKSGATGYIVISADKGLAGAYNHNVLKLAEEHIRNDEKSRLYVLGELGRAYFTKRGIDVDHQFHYTVQNPTLSRARSISEFILDEYTSGKLSEVYIVYTRMKNAMTEEAELIKLLPLSYGDFKNEKIPAEVPHEEMSFYPSPKALMDQIVPDYISGFIYGALIESYSSEQHARMTAMKTAGDSGKAMLSELKVLYNRVRQAKITQEITEVAAGAKAQNADNDF